MAQALRLAYFAWVRERIGLDGEERARPTSGTTIEDLLDQLSAEGAGYAAAFTDRSRIRAALDQQFTSLDAPIGDARELALFPPVTGG